MNILNDLELPSSPPISFPEIFPQNLSRRTLKESLGSSSGYCEADIFFSWGRLGDNFLHLQGCWGMMVLYRKSFWRYSEEASVLYGLHQFSASTHRRVWITLRRMYTKYVAYVFALTHLHCTQRESHRVNFKSNFINFSYFRLSK